MLKIVINDEHHYRSMVQSRMSFHTSIILALIGLSGALTLKAESTLSYISIALLGWLIRYISSQASDSVERLYDHFIEAIRAREEIEAQLGVRDLKGQRKKTTDPSMLITPVTDNNRYWPYKEDLIPGTWIPPKEGGFFKKTQKTFETFNFIGFSIFCSMLIAALLNLA